MAVAGAIITGVFGGILRDIFCARIPLVFQKELYASISLLIGSLYVACNYASKHYFPLDENTIIIACLTIGFIIRLVAIRYHLGLPTFKFNPKTKLTSQLHFYALDADILAFHSRPN